MNAIVTTEFKVWRTLKASEKRCYFSNSKSVSRYLEEKGSIASGIAMNMLYNMEGFEWQEIPSYGEWDFTKVTLGEIGIDKPISYCGGELQKVVNRLGLRLVPRLATPFLRTIYADQPDGEKVYVASSVTRFNDDWPGIFTLVHDENGLWLSGNTVWKSDLFQPDSIWIFGQDRKQVKGSSSATRSGD